MNGKNLFSFIISFVFIYLSCCDCFSASEEVVYPISTYTFENMGIKYSFDSINSAIGGESDTTYETFIDLCFDWYISSFFGVSDDSDIGFSDVKDALISGASSAGYSLGDLFRYNPSNGQISASEQLRIISAAYYNEVGFSSSSNGWVKYNANDVVNFLEYGTVPNIRVINFTRQDATRLGPFVGSYYTFISDNSGTTQGSSGTGKGLAMIWINPSWQTSTVVSGDSYYATWYYTIYTGGSTTEKAVGKSATARRDNFGDYHLVYTFGDSISPTSASAYFDSAASALDAFFHGGTVGEPILNGDLYYNDDLTFNPTSNIRNIVNSNPNLPIYDTVDTQDEVNQIIKDNSPSNIIYYFYTFTDLATNVKQDIVIYSNSYTVPDVSDFLNISGDLPLSNHFVRDVENLLPDELFYILFISLVCGAVGLILRG